MHLPLTEFFRAMLWKKINNSCLEEVCVTDSIPQAKNQAVCPKLRVITIAPLLAEAIRRLHTEKSLSKLFNEPSLDDPPSQIAPPDFKLE